MPKSLLKIKENPKDLPVAKKNHKWVHTGSVGDFVGIPDKKETTVLTPVEKSEGKVKLGDKDEQLV